MSDDELTDDVPAPSIEEILARWAEIRGMIVEFDGYPPEDSPAMPRWEALHRKALGRDYPAMIFFMTYRADIMGRLSDLGDIVDALAGAFSETTEAILEMRAEVRQLATRVEATFPSDEQLKRHGFHPSVKEA